jgi:hypothetical protein
MDITAPSALTELNTTATERLQRYLNNYDQGVINNWRFTAGQKFQDEIEKYEEVKQQLMTPFEVGAALPEINTMLRKGGRKIDETLDTIREARRNPKTALQLLEDRLTPETKSEFQEFKEGISNLKSVVKQKINELTKPTTKADPLKFKSMSQTRRAITPDDLEEIKMRTSGLDNYNQPSFKQMDENEVSKLEFKPTPEQWAEWGKNGREMGENEASTSVAAGGPTKEQWEQAKKEFYDKQLQDAKTQDDQIKSIEKDEVEGVDGNTPSIEEQGGKLATEEAAGETVGEAAAETAGEEAGIGAAEAALGGLAEFAGPVGVAGLLGVGLYNLFKHGMHPPHPTDLKQIPNPELPKDINYNSIIRPHVNSVADHSSGLTNF